jgi:transcriptional regulator with XRE-family HTH domain
MSEATSLLSRIADAIPEARREHGLSQRQLAALSGISRDSIAKVERGGTINPALLVRLGAAIVVLDAYRPPEPEVFDADLFSRLADGSPWLREQVTP